MNLSCTETNYPSRVCRWVRATKPWQSLRRPYRALLLQSTCPRLVTPALPHRCQKNLAICCQQLLTQSCNPRPGSIQEAARCHLKMLPSAASAWRDAVSKRSKRSTYTCHLRALRLSHACSLRPANKTTSRWQQQDSRTEVPSSRGGNGTIRQHQAECNQKSLMNPQCKESFRQL